MSSKQPDKGREYEAAATELVDLEEFHKYMAEEEAPAKAAEEPAPSRPAPAAPPTATAPPAVTSYSTQYVSPKASAVQDTRPDNSRLAAILGVVSLIPGLGLILGPAAVILANREKQEIEGGHSRGSLQQANLGLYLGVAGSAISVALLLYVVFGS